MTKPKSRAETPAHLVLIGNNSGEPFIGCHGVPNRLPTLLRWPGEEAQAFARRALGMLDGAGQCTARLMYASEGPLQ